MATIAAITVGAFVVLLMALRLQARPRETRIDLTHEEGNRRLVVLVHGLLGRARFASAIDLAREAVPGSDLLIADYDSRVLSNADPYAIANAIERRIHDADAKYTYDEIVLVGHSMGGLLLRKAVVWGNGLEEDRQIFGLRGARRWVRKTTRFVSLATINRGWSIDPRPERMTLPTLWMIWIGEWLARLSQSGKLGLGMQKGSPFVADARVQWISLCRQRDVEDRVVPQTIHLLGDRDDIVSKEDSMDLIAVKDTTFVTLQDTGHKEIGTALGGGQSQADRDRREKVRLAVQGRLHALELDNTETLSEDLAIDRVVYIRHS
jgi:hypothetical protein